eukprot:jgi/Botrbrau1/4947/Bobra.0122s0025.1
MSTNITCLACPTSHESWPPTFGVANLHDLPYSIRLQAVGAYALASALWTYSIVRPLPIGWQRFIAATPIIAGHLLIPFLLNPQEDVLTLFGVSFCFAWLSVFKVLQLCANRGPLRQRFGFSHFFAIFLLPILPRSGSPGETGKDGLITTAERGRVMTYHLVCLLGDIAVLAVTVTLLLAGLPLPKYLVNCLYTLGLYMLLSALLDAVAIPSAGSGLRLAQHFQHPYLSTSFGELWSKRWNLVAGTTLRNLIYEPISEGRLIHDPHKPPAPRSLPRYLVAVSTTFLVSGLMHEVVFWYLRGYHPRATGMWLIFFAGCGPICILEGFVLSSLKKRGIVPPVWLSIPVTVLGGIAWGHLFFFPPVDNSGLADDVINAVHSVITSLVSVGPTGLLAGAEL